MAMQGWCEMPKRRVLCFFVRAGKFWCWTAELSWRGFRRVVSVRVAAMYRTVATPSVGEQLRTRVEKSKWYGNRPRGGRESRQKQIWEQDS